MLNLFLAILLDNFESDDIPEERKEKAMRRKKSSIVGIEPINLNESYMSSND